MGRRLLEIVEVIAESISFDQLRNKIHHLTGETIIPVLCTSPHLHAHTQINQLPCDVHVF